MMVIIVTVIATPEGGVDVKSVRSSIEPTPLIEQIAGTLIKNRVDQGMIEVADALKKGELQNEQTRH